VADVKLTELEPQWLVRDGKRVGVIFRNPMPEHRKWRVTCFAAPTPHDDQEEIVHAAVGETDMWQGCNPASGWKFEGGIDGASFEALTITPSLDGGPHWWHGFVTGGVCR
jgi:hypothetical protein